MSCILDHGDEVIIPAPYWVSIHDIVELTEQNLLYSCGIEQAFKMTAITTRRSYY